MGKCSDQGTRPTPPADHARRRRSGGINDTVTEGKSHRFTRISATAAPETAENPILQGKVIQFVVTDTARRAHLI
jgi:hypothetical protein